MSRSRSWSKAAISAPKKLIEDRGDALERIAMALLEREVLDGAEVQQLINGQTLAAVQPPPTGDGTQQVIKRRNRMQDAGHPVCSRADRNLRDPAFPPVPVRR